jgi:hemerythrin superfamily protein
MAQTKRKTTSRSSASKSKASNDKRQATTKSAAAKRNGNGAGKMDAIALLKQDHREVEQWFAEFEKARAKSKKEQLAEKICLALTAHTLIEEEIFYPAFLEATDETSIHHEAEVEHAGAKNLIAQIQESDSSDEYFEARVKVLSEMIKHHVKEEEQRDGMFAKAKQADMDLKALGEELESRKKELMSDKESLRQMALAAGTEAGTVGGRSGGAQPPGGPRSDAARGA